MFALMGVILCVTQTPQSEDAERASKLKLQLSMARGTLDPMEVNQFTVRFTNVSEESIKLEILRTLRAGVALKCTDPQGGQWTSVNRGPLRLTAPVTYELGPGEYVEKTAFCSLSFLRAEGKKEKFGPPQPGLWKIHAVHEGPTGELKSNIFRIEVRDDAAVPLAVREIVSRETWHNMALGGEVTPEEFNSFKTLVLSGAETGGMAMELGIRDLNASRPREALRMFEIAVNWNGQGAAKGQAMLWKAACHWKLKEFDEAIGILDRIAIEERDVAKKRINEMKAGIQRESREQQPR